MRLGYDFQRAFEMALDLHRCQPRKSSKGSPDIPYMGHLLGVTAIVLDDGGSENEAIAALLHDGPEDQGGKKTLARIHHEFGDEVADIVKALSDSFRKKKDPWPERKEKYYKKLREMPDNDLTRKVLRVSIADKLHNARAIAFDYDKVGEEVWDRFRVSNAKSEVLPNSW